MAKSKVLIKSKKGRKTWLYKYDYMQHYLSTPVDNDGTKASYEKAKEWVYSQLNNKVSSLPILFGEYTKDFFIVEKCKWLKDRFADGKDTGDAYIKSLRSNLLKYIIPYFKDYIIQDIKVTQVKDFKAHLKELNLSNQTICHILETLSIIMKWAEVNEVILFNPVVKAGSPKVIKKQRGQLTDEEMSKLFPENMNDFKRVWKNKIVYGILSFIAANTGARRSELLALRWKHLKTKTFLQDNKEINYTYLIIEDAIKAGAKEIGTTKGCKARAVLLSQRSIELLEYIKNMYIDTPKQDFIFKGKDWRKPLHPATISKVFKKVILKICPNAVERNIVFHSFRHKKVTDDRRKMDQDVFMFMIGHEDKKTTDNYDGAKAEKIILDYIEQGKLK